MPPVPSALAEFYGAPKRLTWGIPNKTSDALRPGNIIKSGLTPSILPINWNDTDFKTHKKIKEYQKTWLRGFTAEELETQECLAPFYYDTRDPVDTNTPICDTHPIFAKTNWQNPLPKHQALFPLKNGRPGFWHVDNPIVWEALEPGIRIASMLLGNPFTSLWWEALINGQYTKIDPNLVPKRFKNKNLYCFSPQPTLKPASDKVRRLQDYFEEFAVNGVEFHLCSGDINPETGLKRASNGVAVAVQSWIRKSTVWFSFETLEPLLSTSPALTAAEKTLCHFKVATTLLHELAHVLWHKLCAEDKGERVAELDATEPYFKGDHFGELGCSMELSVFGGLTSGFEFNRPNDRSVKGLPIGGFFQSETVTKYDVDTITSTNRNPVLNSLKPDSWSTQKVYPVPIQYFIRLHSKDFWDGYVDNNTAAHMGPRVHGSSFTGKGNTLELVNLDAIEVEMKDLVIDKDHPDEKRRNEDRALQKRLRRKIQDATGAKEPRTVAPSLNFAPSSIAKSSSVAAVTYERIEEIINLLELEENRAKLAIHSMHFEMGEHVFYSHIRRVTTIDITPEEFRAVLVKCQSEKKYFSFRRVNEPPMPTQGIVGILPQVWNSLVGKDCEPPQPLQPQYNVPSAEIMFLFDKCIEKVMDPTDLGFFYLSDQYDTDLSLFVQYTNLAARNLFEGRQEPAPQFTEEEFCCCINEWRKRKQRWTFGPSGIIRRLKEGWDSPETPAKGKRKATTAKIGQGKENSTAGRKVKKKKV